jgi:hypothetical protein
MPPAFLNRPALAAALAVATLAALPVGTARAEWRDIPYADVAKAPLALAKIDPQHVFTVVLVAKPGKGLSALPAGYQLQVKLKGQVIPVPVAADGRLSLPFRQDWADAGAILQSNQPKGTVGVNMRFDARVPAGTKMSYAQLTESAPILEKGIREMAGMMSFMAPGVTSITLKFASAPQTVVLTLPGGKKQSWTTDAKGQIVLPWEPKWAAGAVELSAPLTGIDQTLK